MELNIIEIYQTLSKYQKEVINRTLLNFLNLNEEIASTIPSVCPVCGKKHSRFIKKGFAGNKQRYLCKECHHKFVYNRGMITYHSYQSMDKWAIVIQDTLEYVPIVETASKIDVCTVTVFNMRHKILIMIEEFINSKSVQLSGLIEVDEAFLNDSYKGSKVPTGRKARKHGESATKRGISNEKVCICTASDRSKNRIIKCVNRAKPSKEDIEIIYSGHIQKQSILINDGVTSYMRLLMKNHCKEEIVPNHHYYNQVYHLNTVNNLHSQIKMIYRMYRGVATKYLNRYLSLINFIQECIGMDSQEKLHYFLHSLQEFKFYITNSHVKSHNLLLL